MPPKRILNEGSIDDRKRPAKVPRGVYDASEGGKRDFFVYYSISKAPFQSRDTKIKVTIGDEVDDIIKAIKIENSSILAHVDAAQIQLFKSEADVHENSLLSPWEIWDPNVKWGTKRDPVIADCDLCPITYKKLGNEKSFFVYYRVSVDGKLSQRSKISVNIGNDVGDMKKLINMENSSTFASIDAIQIKISCNIAECERRLKSVKKWDPNVTWGTKTNPLIVKLSGGSIIEHEVGSERSNIGTTITPNQVRTSNDTIEPESAVTKSDCELELQDTEEEEDDEDFHSEEVDNSVPLFDGPATTKSDSELEVEESEEEDEDCNCDNVDNSVPVIFDGPTHIIVERAGNPAVNGTYKKDGIHENALRYVRNGLWKNKRRLFVIWLWSTDVESEKDWFITMLGANPDTDKETDFYSAPMSDDSIVIPARVGWVANGIGKNPSPRLVFIEQC